MNLRPDRVEAGFSQAVEQPSLEAREAFLQKFCGEDEALLGRLRELLLAYDGADEFLEQAPVVERAASQEDPEVAAEFARLKPEEAGDRIGPYKLLEQIGEGGFGVVWVAEQERPVRRRVALKIIKLGMDTKDVIARFEQERQALAMMEHPNIARVLDAGATQFGRPFFAMELVRGIKITDYCDQANLPTSERLKLFIQVCHAVQHAHQKGIIHRDIKPSNILVTLHDGVPVPKVIDFGIAKATEGRLTDATVYTQLHQFIGTPAYMSPEQAERSGLDIDTRSDIYSLGVLLYELLTGKTPFDAKELLESGLEAMRHTIREKEPQRPSTKLSTMLDADLIEVAKRHGAEPPKLIHLIRGDLDWIVMKALEKDRTRRYETANGLGMDIQRHLADEPVLARPASQLYRFQRMVRRNKLAFAAGLAVAAALVLGVVASTLQAVRATREKALALTEKRRADEEAAKATAISDFLQQLLRSANPDALKGSEYTVRQLLDDFSAGLANQLKDQPEVEAAVRATIGRAYYRLGVADKAQPNLERALTLRRRVFGDQAEPVAESLVDYAWVCFEQGQYEKGEPYVREALEIYRKRGTAEQPVISALRVLQRLLIVQERFADVDAVTEEASTIARKSPGVEFPELASMIHGLAEVKNRQSHYAEAESLARKAVEMHRRLSGAEHPETAWALLNMGTALRGQQKLTDAEAAVREALRIFRKYYSSGHKSVDAAMAELKLVLEAKGDAAAVEALYREILAGQRAALGNDSPGVALTLLQLADVLKTQKKADEAVNRHREALEIASNLRADATNANLLNGMAWQLATAENPTSRDAAVAVELAQKAVAATSRKTPFILDTLAAAYAAAGQFTNAVGVQQEAIAILQDETQKKNYASRLRLYQSNSPYRDHTALAQRVSALLAQGKFAEAEAVCREELAMERKRSGDEHPFVADSLQSLAAVLRASGKSSEAEALFREALDMRRKLLGNEDPAVATSLSWLGATLSDQGKHAEAEATQREALAMRRRLLGDESLEVANSFILLVDVLRAEGKLVEAETFLRDALVLNRNPSTNAASKETPVVGLMLYHLANVLRERKVLTEARSLAEEATVLYQRHPDWPANERQDALHVLAAVLTDAGDFAGLAALCQQQLEELRARLAADDPRLAGALAELTQTLLLQQKFAEAEPPARECLAIREKKLPDDWRTFNARSMLGGSLLAQKKYAEAEPLLLSGYEGMKQREDKIPAAGKPRLKETLQRLVQLYEATNRPDQAIEWKKKLDLFNHEEAAKKAATAKEAAK